LVTKRFYRNCVRAGEVKLNHRGVLLLAKDDDVQTAWLLAQLGYEEILEKSGFGIEKCN